MKIYKRLVVTLLMLAAICAAHALPYQNLTLLQEIDAGAAPSGVFPNGNYESDGSDSVQTILGQPVRVTNGQVGWFGYKLGSNLQYDKPYVIEVVYPEDTARAWLMSLMDCGGWQPGSHYALQTGVYESETYQSPMLPSDPTKPNPQYNPINTVAYPLRQQFKSYWIVTYPQQTWWAEGNYSQFPTTHGAWTTGLWLYFINKSDDPGNHGVAVKTIRIYSVPDTESLIDPQVDNLRVNSPRKTFWTLESPGRNTTMTQAAKARVAGANILVPSVMDWNYQHSNDEYNYYRTQIEIGLREAIPAARRHRMGIIPKLEYGGSPFMPADAYAVTANNVGYDQELTKLGHGDGLYTCVNPRSPAARSELKHMIDVVFEGAGPDADLIKGVMIRNRLALIAPSFSDTDLTAFETETGTTIAETDLTPQLMQAHGEEIGTPNATSFDKKRRTLRLAFWNKKWREWGEAVRIGENHNHPYMQWYYRNVAAYLEEAESHMKATYGNDKVLLYLPFSGEGVFQPAMTPDPADFFAGQEWGYEPGMSSDKHYLTLMPTDQYWNAREAGYLNALNSLGGQATLVDPMYVEFGWSGTNNFPYAKIAPSFEHGGQEYSIRSEILAMANANPRVMGKTSFGVINRCSPDHWNAFAKNYYLIPDEAGTTIVNTADITVKTYSGGRVLVINKSLVSQTVNLGATYPTLYNKITGASVNTSAITLAACTMQMYGTQSGGLPAYTVLPEPPPGPPRHIAQFEDGTIGGTGGTFNSNTQPQSNGLNFSFASGTGSWIDVVVNVPRAGTYDLKFRYSLPSGTAPLDVYVNNTLIAPAVGFPATGHWRGYQYFTVGGAQLFAGDNVIRMKPAVSGGPSLDQVEAILTGPPVYEILHLGDEFTGGTAGNWSGGATFPWSVVSEDGDNAYKSALVWSSTAPNVAGSPVWTDYQLDVDFEVTEWNSYSYTYLYARYVDAATHYRLNIQYTGSYHKLQLYRYNANVGTLLGTYNTSLSLHTWYHAALSLFGNHLVLWLDDAPVLDVIDPAPITAGSVAIGTSKQLVFFDNVYVSAPRAPQIVYQGEDRTSTGPNSSVGSSIAAYTGTGYVETSANGAWFEWNNVNEGVGTKTLTFRYINGSSYNRAYKVYVNGALAGTIPCSNSGGWSTWSTVNLTGVNLATGNNVIRLEASTWSGGPGGAVIDKMEVH